MLRIFESKKPLKELAADLEKAVASHKFGVLGVHDLKAKMAEKGVVFARECRIYEVCNPHQAKKVLEANLEISTALPCRISLYEEGGRTKLAILRPCIASHKQQERPAKQHRERHPEEMTAAQVPQANAFQMVLHRGILTEWTFPIPSNPLR